MPRTLTEASIFELNQTESATPFLWLYEIQTLDDPSEMYRLVNYHEILSHRGQPYYPAPIATNGFRSTSDGDIPTFDFSMGNASLEVAPIIDAGNGYIGQFARVTLINFTELGDDNAGVPFEGEIVALSMDHKQINVSIGARDLYRAKIPPFRYTRRKCRFLFGDGNCLYSLLTSGALTACPGYTFEACTVVGEDEAANSLPVQHPKRFGGFPGIPKLGGRL